MKTFAKHLSRYALLAAFTFISVNAFAEESVNLRGEPAPKPGRITVEVIENLATDGTVVLSTGVSKKNGTSDIRELITKRTEELEGGKVKVIIIQDQITSATNIGEVNDNSHETGALVDIPIIGEQTNGKWTFKREYVVPSDAQQEELDDLEKEEENKLELYPDRAIKVGESWTLSQKAINHLMGEVGIDASGNATMTLIDIVPFDGQRCALIELNLEAGETITEEDTPGQASIKLKGYIYRSLEMFDDIKADLIGSVKVEYTLADDTKITMSGPAKFTGRITYE